MVISCVYFSEFSSEADLPHIAEQTCIPDRAFTHDATKGRSDDADFKKALASITARTLVLPGQTDLYFPVSSSARGFAPFLR